MKKSIFFLVFITLALIANCTDNGGDKMKQRLRPIKIKSFGKISGISGIGMKDHLAGINSKGEFTLIKIDGNERIRINEVVNNFPPFDGWELRSDNEYNYIWKTRGRGFYVVDIDTKKTGHCVASNDGDDKVVNTQLIDPENKIFMIELSRLNRFGGIAGFIYVLYDLYQDKIVYTSQLYKGRHYRISKDKILFCEVYGENNNLVKWYYIDYHGKKVTDDKLTEKLTKMQILVYPKKRNININQKFMIGTGKINKELVYYTVRWDEKFEDIKIEPIILQRPDGNFMDEAFEFSGDGKWVKTLRFPYNNGREMPPELMIYHVSDIYPQGLSLPILCGFTSQNTQGAFMDHSEWGMCYVQRIDENTLYVYKLLDGLKLLAEEAKKSITGGGK